MDAFTSGILGIVLLTTLLVVGMPIGVALAISGFIGSVLISGLEIALTSTVVSMYYRVANYQLVVAPLFILMGFLAAGGGMSESIFHAAQLWLGKIKAGIGIATVWACAAFGAICGSSLVTAAVFSKISAPEMRKHGYGKRIAYGICASSGTIGMLIPPSILAVVYGIVSGESMGKLLIAGVGPGIVLSICYSIGLVVIALAKPNWIETPSISIAVTWNERFASLLPCWPVLVVVLIVFGGIFGGVFSPTEAGSVAAFVMLALFFIVKRSNAFKQIRSSFTDASVITAMLFLILIGSGVFSHLMVMSGITKLVSNVIIGSQLSPYLLLLCVVGMYMVMGCFLDSISIICVTVPIIHPVMVDVGLSPIWYAMVAILAIEIGLITPPVGLNVFGAQAAAESDVSIEDVFIGATPFFILALVTLAIVIIFPDVATFLPNAMITR